MKICYFVPGPMSRGPLGPGELVRRRDFLAARAAGGTRVELVEAEDGPASVETGAEERLAARALLDELPALERRGLDALIVGCFGDPGVAEARQRVTLPVIGPAQASVEAAAGLGQRFGILTVAETVLPTVRRLVDRYGLASRMASLRAVEVPVLELQERREEVLERLAREGRAAVDEGADSLVLGCMTMGFLDVAGELQRELGVPVVNPVLGALRRAETAGLEDSAGASTTGEGEVTDEVTAGDREER